LLARRPVAAKHIAVVRAASSVLIPLGLQENLFGGVPAGIAP